MHSRVLHVKSGSLLAYAPVIANLYCHCPVETCSFNTIVQPLCAQVGVCAVPAHHLPSYPVAAVQPAVHCHISEHVAAGNRRPSLLGSHSGPWRRPWAP